eukprot:TRINITY_DN5244_c0_g2_i1.p1 TRINITY_DN5244_c0_g2~~TRINITY_DN5244_c0_g2_i1.p1  ORF type:complete len:134 (-),score=27.28 TRINITY_DN5244_c0_g2_i1:521-922(-)
MTWFKAMLVHRWSPFRLNRIRKIAAEKPTTEFSSLQDIACTTTAGSWTDGPAETILGQSDFLQPEARQTDPAQRERPGGVEARGDSDVESVASSFDMNDPQVRARCETLLFVPDAEEYMDPETVRRYREECRL